MTKFSISKKDGSNATDTALKEIQSYNNKDTYTLNEITQHLQKRDQLQTKVKGLMIKYEEYINQHQSLMNRITAVLNPIKEKRARFSDLPIGEGIFYDTQFGCPSTHEYIAPQDTWTARMSEGGCALNNQISPNVSPNFSYTTQDSELVNPQKSLLILEDGTIAYQGAPDNTDPYYTYLNPLTTNPFPTKYNDVYIQAITQSKLDVKSPDYPYNEGAGGYYIDGDNIEYILQMGDESTMKQGKTNGNYVKHQLVNNSGDKPCKYADEWQAWKKSNTRKQLSTTASLKIKTGEPIDICVHPPPFAKLIPIKMQTEMRTLIDNIAQHIPLIQSTINEIDSIDIKLSINAGTRDSLINDKSLLLEKLQGIINLNNIYADVHTIEGQHQTMFLNQRSNYLDRKSVV